MTRTDCLEWPHGKANGYGTVKINNKAWRVHRLVYLLHHGWLPEVVMHTCDNPACYNLAHLKGGTQLENIADMKAKGRARALQRDEHPRSVLTTHQVGLIKDEYSRGGVSQRTLAERYNTSQKTIFRVLRS